MTHRPLAAVAAAFAIVACVVGGIVVTPARPDVRGWVVQLLAPAPGEPVAPAFSPRETLPSPGPTALRSSPGFQVGLNMRRWAANDAQAARILKPKVVRFALDTDPATPVYGRTPSQWVDFYARLGAMPQPLVDFDNGVPTDAQVDAIAAWARREAGRIRLIEFGNEDSMTYKYGDGPEDASYQERAQAYGREVVRLGRALVGSGVGVLAQDDTIWSTWVDQMYAAAPDLDQYIAGWAVHPYGPDAVSLVNAATRFVRAHGSHRPLYVTELGLATAGGAHLTDNYGWPANMTYTQAAAALRETIDALRGEVAQVLLYQSTDQDAIGQSDGREYYFGVLQADGKSAKGALTRTAISLLTG